MAVPSPPLFERLCSTLTRIVTLSPRAAGTACSTNPIPIIYPCHRVVRAGGALGNYGGGSNLDPKHPDNLGRKQALIDLERRFA